jgi:23S rRNA (pseudouridine1915-N3)-methyltransferase
MQKITVIAVGSDKEKYFTEAAKEYEKRLSRYAKTEVIILKDEPIPEDPSEREMQAVLEKEGKKILAAIPDGCMKVALCVEGKQLSSEEFAERLDSIAASHGEVAIIIGSSFGLSEQVKRACDMRMSVSKMTLTHQMLRVWLVEIIYRCLSISHGGKYHK